MLIIMLTIIAMASTGLSVYFAVRPTPAQGRHRAPSHRKAGFPMPKPVTTVAVAIIAASVLAIPSAIAQGPSKPSRVLYHCDRTVPCNSYALTSGPSGGIDVRYTPPGEFGASTPSGLIVFCRRVVTHK